jgi:hypothetical protein
MIAALLIVVAVAMTVAIGLAITKTAPADQPPRRTPYTPPETVQQQHKRITDTARARQPCDCAGEIAEALARRDSWRNRAHEIRRERDHFEQLCRDHGIHTPPPDKNLPR